MKKIPAPLFSTTLFTALHRWLPIFILTLMMSCDSHDQLIESAKPYQSFRGFEPVDPSEFYDDVPIVVNNKIVFKPIKLLSTEQMLSFLNNETVLVSIGQLTAEGGISYLPVTVSSKGSSYKITMDYMKSTTLAVKDSADENIIGLRRVGVGLRLISLITTFEAGINIGDLSSIGFAVKSGKASGTLMIEVIGIKSKDVTTLIPLPSEINQTTIQNAMQALATIKSKIYDSVTILYPQVMAVNDFYKAKVRNSSTNNGQIIADSIANANKVNIQFGTGNTKSEKAVFLENQGFSHLFDKEVDLAIKSFTDCDKEFPTYHSVSNIATLLKENRGKLIDKNPDTWKVIYKKILKDYSWKLRSDIIEKLNEVANQ